MEETIQKPQQPQDEPLTKILIDVELTKDEEGKKQIAIHKIEIEGNFYDTAVILSQCLENALNDLDGAIALFEICLAEAKARKEKNTPSVMVDAKP